VHFMHIALESSNSSLVVIVHTDFKCAHTKIADGVRSEIKEKVSYNIYNIIYFKNVCENLFFLSCKFK
jgi:hypothetical protein